MLDMIGGIALTGIFAISIGLILDRLPAARPAKTAAGIAAALWAGTIVAVAAAGGFAPGVTGGIPAIAFGLAAPLLAAAFAWRLFPAFRQAMLALPTPLLVSVNAARVLGVFFLILEAQGRLTAPLAPSAGWGDIATGLLAVPVAMIAAGGAARWRPALTLWNAFGAADLFAAVSLAAASAPGSALRVFLTEPGSAAMATLPWVIIPTLLVPFYLIVHFVVAARLVTRSAVRAHA